MINDDEKDHVNKINEKLKRDFKERIKKQHYVKSLKKQQKSSKKSQKNIRN